MTSEASHQVGFYIRDPEEKVEGALRVSAGALLGQVAMGITFILWDWMVTGHYVLRQSSSSFTTEPGCALTEETGVVRKDNLLSH